LEKTLELIRTLPNTVRTIKPTMKTHTHTTARCVFVEKSGYLAMLSSSEKCITFVVFWWP